jgi:hypothetical protein
VQTIQQEIQHRLEPQRKVGQRSMAVVVGKTLIPNLLCLRTAGSRHVYSIELTALQFSDFRVAPWSRC